MAELNSIPIEVAYARPECQRILRLKVPAGTSARTALKLSGLAASFPQIDPDTCPLGIFGQSVADDHVLKAQDRLEVYRPLREDPREARRRLAARGLTMGGC